MNPVYKKNVSKMSKTYHLLAAILFLGVNSNSFATGNDTPASSYLIFNNSSANSDKAVYTNLFTGKSSECSKDSALYEASCNSFSLGDNELQVIQSDATGNLINQIGVNNSDSTSYSNKGTNSQLNFFAPGKHIFDLDKLRNAANEIAIRPSGLPVGSYGTISFQQFINNVANAQPMYGIVRVKIPMIKDLGAESEANNTNDKENDDNDEKEDSSSDSKKGKKSIISTRSMSPKSGKQSNDDKKRGPKIVYKLCGEKPTPECLLCGPGIGTDIKPGSSVCGIKLGANSKIMVSGSLFFDWVDCKTEEPISLDELPDRPRDIYFSISVPINVNPANVDPNTGTMKSLSQIPTIIGDNKCASGSPCNMPIKNPVPFSLVSQEAKDQFKYQTNSTLDASRFSTLTPSQQFGLLFPSGYEQGWATAFSKLGISPTYWQSLGFKTPGTTGFIDIDQVRSADFEDIPAYMYTGGLIDMHYHINISGLVYVPQAIELEQKDMTINVKDECTKGEHEKEDDEDHGDKEKEDDSHSSSDSEDGKSLISKRSFSVKSSGEKESDDKEHDDDENKNTSTCNTSKDDDEHKDDEHGDNESKNSESHKDDDDDKHDSGKDKGTTNSVITFAPAAQYINGAILVRDSFYIEAKQPGGVTIINNDPNTYSNIELSTSSANGGKFQVFPTSAPGGSSGNNGGTGGNSGGSGGGTTSGGGSVGNSGQGSSSSNGDAVSNGNPGAQWVEIRPQ